MKQTDLLISVIIPHLNQPEQLRNCLASLQEQTLATKTYEIIVVDNGSKCLPSSTCASFDGVTLVQEVTPGPGPARNHGVAVARGSILAFIDADCLADREWLATIAETFEANTACQIVGGDVRIAYADTRRITMMEAYESIYAYRQREYIERQSFSGTGNLAVRKGTYEDVGPFAGKDVAEDRDWGRRATGMGYRIDYVAEMIVFHPARTNFAELCTKWDRHVSHDFEENPSGLLGRLRWLGLAVAVMGSPLLEVKRLLMSERVSTWRERFLAAMVLVRIRTYRAQKMCQMLILGRRAGTSKAWNT